MHEFRDFLYLALQRALPQHLLSRLAGRLAETRISWVRRLLIRAAIRRFGIDLTEAAEPDCERYASFNDFFTRALRTGVRPLMGDARTLVSPADGVISEAGRITGNSLLQAKGHTFTLEALLGESGARAAALRDGCFATIYLSPRDYHRVHMPLSGTLIATRYIPGRLFSVNLRTTQALPNLYAGNERLVCWFDTPAGQMAVVLVGALLVAGIDTVWQGRYLPAALREDSFEKNPVELARGAELGRFRFGSTVIVLAPPGVELTLATSGLSVRMGEELGRFTQPR
ncbi:MAG: phosphatidylserine decarboxylase [Porticoccaceae bacterium]|nr:MAG: phosphatidylserine decarboxylase [Porticoccaceae bacterium]